MNPTLEAGLAVTLAKLLRVRKDLIEQGGYRFPNIPKRAGLEKGMKYGNTMAMASLLGMEKQAAPISQMLGSFARSGAALPIAGALAGGAVATPDALRALREGDTTGAALRWGTGTALGTGAGFLGRGLARTTSTLGHTQRALDAKAQALGLERERTSRLGDLLQRSRATSGALRTRAQEGEALGRRFAGRLGNLQARFNKHKLESAKELNRVTARLGGTTAARNKLVRELAAGNVRAEDLAAAAEQNQAAMRGLLGEGASAEVTGAAPGFIRRLLGIG